MVDNDAAVGVSKVRQLYDDVLTDIQGRRDWVDRQTTWYEMRHQGLRRRNKPWPGAADMHYPLADSIIEKFKPFYATQVYSTETIATFAAKNREHEDFAADVGFWFDWQLKQNSNFERQKIINDDSALMSGIGCMKVYYSSDKKRLCFDALDPIFLIVPTYTDELQDTDRITHVFQLSKGQYKRRSNYKQDKSFLAKICGKGAESDTGISNDKEQEKDRREGITYCESGDQIVIWEIWENCGEKGWYVHTISPLCPDEPIRPSMKNPFKHGKAPFVRFDVELKGKGHYDPRGIPERVGSFEASLNKTWNQKLDFITFASKPIFYSEREMPGVQNLKFSPGQIFPFQLNRVDMGRAPEDLQDEMINTRMVAEQNIGMPDFGMGQQTNTNDARTATEIGEISNLSTQGIDLRARINRKSLGELYILAWQTLVQFDPETRFFVDSKARELPPEALAGAYDIQPNGSADDWNKQAKVRKAAARYQMFVNNPHVDQRELAVSVMELDDPRLAKKLVPPAPEMGKRQADKQAYENAVLMTGYPLAPDATDDDAAHVQTIDQFAMKQMAMGAPLPPDAAAAIGQHREQHMVRLRQTNSQLAQQFDEQVAMMAEQMGSMAAGQQQQQQQAPVEMAAV